MSRHQIESFLRRVLNSPVAWSWLYNGVRLASSILLLPLLLRRLSSEDLGMYYVFMRITALVPIIDFGFSVAIGRFTSYAMGGATELKAYGLTPLREDLPPNIALLQNLLKTCHRLYQRLSLAAVILLGTWGTLNVAFNVHDTSSPQRTWLAWGIVLFAAVFEIYAGWWNVFLRGMNKVLPAARFAALGYGVQIVLSCALLFFGYGLLSVPIGSLAGSLLQRSLSKRYCLRDLPKPPASTVTIADSLFPLLWPTTWRTGLQFMSTYLGWCVPPLIYAKAVGMAAFAPYGLSLQLVNFCQGMASVWTAVRWPMVAQYQTRRDTDKMRHVLQPASQKQIVTYLALALLGITIGPLLLQILGTHKQMLPVSWFLILAWTGFLDMRFSFWTTLLSTENRIPSLWPTVATNCLILGINLLVAFKFPHRMLETLVLSPLFAGLFYNYWYWAFAGARSLKVSWFRFIFTRS